MFLYLFALPLGLFFFFFSCRTDLDQLTDHIATEEPLVTPTRKPQLRRLLHKLLEKQMEHEGQYVYFYTVMLEGCLLLYVTRTGEKRNQKK